MKHILRVSLKVMKCILRLALKDTKYIFRLAHKNVKLKCKLVMKDYYCTEGGEAQLWTSTNRNETW